MAHAPGAVLHAVTCPFCGLVCDDLEVARNADALSVTGKGCALSVRSLRAASAADAGPAIAGQAVPLEQAIGRARELLQNASWPLIGGLGTDVNGVRAALALADRCGAVVDHMNSAALFTSLDVVQHAGWLTTTLAEARNRADLVILAGAGFTARFPRLAERLLGRGAHLAGRPRKLVLLGAWDADALPPELGGAGVETIRCELQDLGEIAAALRALLAGTRLQACSVAGVALEVLEELAARLRDARYSVLCWAGAELTFANADLTVLGLVELVRDLNRTTRSAALPLGGSQGDLTANQVCTWQTGYPVRTGFHRGVPEYDPARFAGERLLAAGEVDALVWLSTFSDDRPPPPSDVPTVVLGHPGMRLPAPPEVFIPTGVPGVDHAGHLFRCDGVVALPLRALRAPRWPPAATLLAQIAEGLPC